MRRDWPIPTLTRDSDREPRRPNDRRRGQDEKEARRTSDTKYVERPTLTWVVHSFNRISNLDQLHQGLRSLGPHELVVCDDGSLDGSHQRWLELLDRPNDFLIHSNDLHEIRSSDRAIKLANGELVCLVQDDDQVPTDAVGWMKSSPRSRRPGARHRWWLHGVRQLPPRPGAGQARLGAGRLPLRPSRQHRALLPARARIRAAGWLGPLLLGARRARDLFRQRALPAGLVGRLSASAIASCRSRDPPVTTRWTAAPCCSPPPTADTTGSPTQSASTGAPPHSQTSTRWSATPTAPSPSRRDCRARSLSHLLGRDVLQRDPRPRWRPARLG